jgi:nitroreductase
MQVFTCASLILLTSGKSRLDVFEAVQKRKSVRAYEPTPVPVEKLKKVLEAARLAPSAGNAQPWHFIIVMAPDKRKKIARGCRFGRFLAESPVVIVGCGDQKASPRWHAIDTCIAMENLVLAATGEGLGTCWIGTFNEKEIREMLKIPSHLKVVALLALGYSRETLDILGKVAHLIRPKKKLEKIVHLEEYGKKFLLPSI